uniref:DDB1 and CUL4 associated factor 15 n=1 Tax=Cyclopterus lumpus TaxID=8103 RepID=A0A8C2ZIP5_CYCLU
MAPSSKSEKDDGKQKAKRKHKDHVVKLLMRGKLAGQFSQRLFRKLPPRVWSVRVHVFLGFTKCGRYILSYTSDCGEDDDFSFYTYHLYWWEFKPVHHVRLFAGEEIYSDLYLTVCEWPNDHSKIVIFGFKVRNNQHLNQHSVLMNLMMSDENNRDIYITIASMPPPKPCSYCCPVSFSHFHTHSGECLEPGYVLNSRYQVVYPFPTFQPAFQLKKDQVILLNTSYSLVACGISLCKQGQSSQILYTKRAALSSQASPSFSSTSLASSSIPQGSPESRLPPSKPAPIPSSPSQSQAAVRAREFAADLFRRAQGGGEKEKEGQAERRPVDGGEKEAAQTPGDKGIHGERRREEEDCYEDDKVQLPFTVTDLKGRNLQLRFIRQRSVVCVEQLTLDFEYLINEFCSFSDYDCCDIRGQCVLKPNTVMINIGLLLLAFSNSDEEHCRPNTYHSNLQVSWDLNTGVCCTVGVGDLTEVKGQTSGSVWSSYRKSCVNTVMKWLVPESSSRYINRMTNEALHKGSSLQVLADSDRCTWIVL